MNEAEQNKCLVLLIDKLLHSGDTESVELLGILIENGKPSLKKSYEIMTDSNAPIWAFLKTAKHTNTDAH